jgi:hypothetical protein
VKRIRSILSIILVAILVQGVFALSITVEPESIERGDQVTVAIVDLPDNSTFSMHIEGTFAATPGGTFSFETRNLVLPFALNDGSLSATLRNTDTNVLIVKKGDTEVKKVGLSQNGVFSTTDSGSIPAGTYETISLGGTAAADATHIIASMTIQGRKSGPPDSEITFIVDGVADGEVAITVSVDGGTALSRTIQVGSPVTITPTQTYYSSGGGGGRTSVYATTATTAVTTTPTTTRTTTVTASPTGEETAAPAAVQTVGEVTVTHEPPVTSSPSPTATPLAAYLAPLGIALLLLIGSMRRR